MAHKLTTKGQVTVPLKVRRHLGIAPGDAVDFRIAADGSVQVVPASATSVVAPPDRFGALHGRATVKLSTEEIMDLTRGPGAVPGDGA